jgi:gliding motility-associated-like protein
VKPIRIILLTFFGLLLFAAYGYSQNVNVTISDKKDACRDQVGGDGILDNGSVSITATSGVPPLTLFIIGPSAAYNFFNINLTLGIPYVQTGLIPGNYTIIVQDNSDATTNFNGSATILGTTDVSAGITSGFPINSTSCGTSNGQISIDVSGGTGDYDYSWTATNGFTSTSEDISGLSAGDYTVVVSDNGTNCTQTIGPITITDPISPTNAALNLTGPANVCLGQSSSLSVNITSGTGPFTLNISGFGIITNYTSGSNITVTPSVTTNYSLVSVLDANQCAAATVSGSQSISVITPPDAGADNSVSACNNNSSFNLFASLSGTPSPTGSWSQLSGTARPLVGNIVDLNGAAAGIYSFQYTVNGTAPCPDATAVVTVNVIDAVSAGTDNTVAACNNNPAFDLFASLGGTPDSGGTWLQLSGTTRTITGNNVNFSGATSGAYTFRYTVLGTSPCPNASAIVTVNVTTAPNAGANNTVTSCNNNSSFNLFTSLGGTPDTGGAWLQLTGTSRTITGNSVDINGATAGTYTFQYTIVGSAPCANTSAVVTLNVVAASNAGLDNTVAACNNNTSFNLFTSLLGTPDSGGTWTQLAGSVRTITGNSVDLVGAPAGAYSFRYTVLGVSPCSNVSSVVTVNVVAAPNAGIDNTVTSCNNNSAFNLFASLGGTPNAGGSWIQLTGTSKTITGNNVDLAGAGSGAYSFQYTVVGTAPCVNATSIVIVNVVSAPNAGTNNTVAACNNTNSFNLFTSLGGTPDSGGSWTQLTGSSTIPISGNDANLNGANAGAYTFQYTLAGTAPCPSATAVVTVNLTRAPNAGVDNNVSACNNENSFNLFNSIGGTPDPVGTWTQLTGTTRTITGNNVDLDGALAGAYSFRYEVLGPAPCANATSIVTINVVTAANAGLSNTITTCNNVSSLNLITSLGGTPETTGTWTQLSGASLIVISSNSGDFTGAVAGTYTFQYLVTGVVPCADAMSILTVNVIRAAFAGGSNTVTSCNDNSAFNLFNNLIGTPDVGGSWAQLVGLPRTITGNTVDLNGAAAGTYTFEYTVSGTAPCSDAVAQIVVTIDGSPSIGLTVAASPNPVCSGGTSNIEIAASETGVSYQLRNNTDNMVVGDPVIGTGGPITLPTDPLTTTTTFNVLATRGVCPPVQLTATVTVTVAGVINTGLTVTATPSPICEGTNSSIQIEGTEVGVNYQLRDGTNPIGTPVAGNGGTIMISTGPLTTATTFNILASNGACSIELTNQATVAVDVDPNPALPVTGPVATLCIGGIGSIRVDNSEVGVNYQLRNNAGNLSIGDPVAGTGGTIALPTGALAATTTFNVLATGGVCPPVELATLVIVNVSGFVDLSLDVTADQTVFCAGSGTNINIDNSEVGVDYQLLDNANDNPLSAVFTGTGAPLIIPTVMLTATTDVAVLASNISCAAKLNTITTLTVNPSPDLSFGVAARNNQVCFGTFTFIEVSNSELGVSYQLRIDDTTNTPVGAAVAGTGSAISLRTGNLTANTTFNVFASIGTCSGELISTASVTVLPSGDPLCAPVNNCATVVITPIETPATCGALVPDGTVTFDINPAVPLVNIIGVRIEIDGPLARTQFNNALFTDLPVGIYSYTIAYGDDTTPACIKVGTFEIESSGTPDPVNLVIAATAYNCLEEDGSISITGITGSTDTNFTFNVYQNGDVIQTGPITADQAASGLFVITGLPLGEYQVQLTQDQADVNTCVGLIASVFQPAVIVEPAGGCGLFVPNIFTPNGDNSNETFFIRNLPANCKLVVTNRWGKQVFSSDNYQNDWTGDDASDGVYYYQLVVDGERYTGWVEIMRGN